MSRFSLGMFTVCLAGLATLAMAMPGRGQEAGPDSQATPTTRSNVVELPIENGTVKSSLVFDAVADDLHWIAGGVAGFSRAWELDGSISRLGSQEMDELIRRFPSIFQYRLNDQSQPVAFVIERAELATKLADRKSRLRQWLADAQDVQISSLTKVEETWTDPSARPPRIVIAMAGLHGFESSAQTVALELHKQAALPMCVFQYPNDAPISESAQRLVELLGELHREYPDSKLSLVTHSMGGLVARAALELPQELSAASRDPYASRYGVDQLIAVCPPNHGSAIARYGPVLEAGEQLVRLVDRRMTRQSRFLLGAITDGLNEASADLIPGSHILEQLDAQPRNPHVRYTILAGDDGPLRTGIVLLLGTAWQRLSDLVDEPQSMDQRVRDLLQCDELQKGKGDGVVSLASARLAGVEDFQILPMHHLCWSQLDSQEGQELIRNIASRIEH